MQDAVNHFRTALLTLEVLACVAGFVSYRKFRQTYWSYFPWYLLVIVVVEVTASMMTGHKEVVNHLYRFFGIPVQFIFFYWLVGKSIKFEHKRNWALIASLIYIATVIIDVLWIGGLSSAFLSFSYTIGNIMLLIFIIIFFFQFMISDDILKFQKNMMFWTALGLLIFYLGSLPFYGLYYWLKDSDILITYWFVQMVLNCCMYPLFIIGFLWSNPKS